MSPSSEFNSPNFSIVFINIRSMRENLAIFLSSLIVQFDIPVTETRLTAEISSFIDMCGYQCINLFRNRHCGGISVYYNMNIKILLKLFRVILCICRKLCIYRALIGLQMKTYGILLNF